MTSGAAWRGGRAATLTLSLAALLGLSAVAPHGFGAAPARAQDFWESEYERNQQDLGEARTQLGVLGNDITSATAELKTIANQLAGMYRDLAAQRAELDAATAELQVAQARTAAADAEVAQATARLQEAEAERAATETVFEARVVTLWKHGTRGYAQAILESTSISDAILQANYVGRVLDGDAELLDEIAAAQVRITEERATVDRARDRLRLQESAVASAVTAVARLERVQQVLVSQVESQQQRQQAVLNTLHANERSYRQTIAALEAESARIEQELRKSRYAAGKPGKGELVWPTSGSPGSGYGYRTHPISGERKLHTGVDIAAPTGQKIVAAAKGLVVSATWRGGYGLAVVIDHGGGVATLYAHQSRLAVSEGDIVSSGQTIGYIGTTGYSTGPHLHFEVRVDGTPVDPMDWY